MADLTYLSQNFDEDPQNFGDEESDDFQLLTSALDAPTQDDVLSSLGRLQKYAASDNSFNRQMAARGLLDSLRNVGDPEERDVGLEVMLRLSEDPEPNVRAELMEQIPHIAMLCQENRSFFPNTIQDYILPTVIRYLTDSNNQVRKTSQAALLVLLEQDLIERTEIEEQVCPIIVKLSGQGSSEDYRNEAVVLMSKITPLIGKDVTLNMVLPQFVELCSDSMFHIRKVCAANFGDICNVVGEYATEDLLLPKFEDLCEDGVWGVRKACAECFMAVSWAVSRIVRRDKLSPLFVKLLCDQSRWVRMAAFQTLGPFISTFADPSVSGVQVVYTPDCSVQIASVVDNENDSNEVPSLVFSESQSSNQSSTQNSSGQEVGKEQRTQSAMQAVAMEVDETIGGGSGTIILGESKGEVEVLDTNKAQPAHASSNVHHGVGKVEFTPENVILVTPEVSPSYDSFLFWRNPIPVIDIQPEITEPLPNEEPSERFTTIAELTLETSELGDGNDEQKSSPDSGIASPSDTPESIPEIENDKSPSSETDQTNNEIETSSDVNEVQENLSDVQLHDSAEATPESLDTNANVNANVNDTETTQPQSTESVGIVIHKANLTESDEVLETVSNICSTHVIGQRVNEKTLTFRNGIVEEEVAPDWPDSDPLANMSSEVRTPEHIQRMVQQDVIPAELLDLYLSMTDPSRAQTVDTEIARHCAFSLPGVALTMGRKNWTCLKEVYETLASDMQWKVRRTLAFSIHEIALILGDEITAKDLVPIFNSFLRDLDEVRIGVLKHFAAFVKLLNPELRRQYLNRMTDFLTMDNARNWRFRLELAEQLILLCDMYNPTDVCEHLFPIALTLAGDRVADVRFTAYRLLGVIMKRINTVEDMTLCQNFIDGIIAKYANSDRWFGRQTFIHLCQSLLEIKSVENDQFAANLLPSLLNLVNDTIPNVRITLARLLTCNLLPIDFYQTGANPFYDKMMDVLSQLQEDTDRDVRYYSSYTFVNNMHSKHIDHPV